MRLAGIAASAALVLLVLTLPVSSATDQINTRTLYPADWYYTPTDYPCLVETIHVTGSFEERLHVLFNPGGGYSWQVKQTTKDMTAVGLTTGETYQYNGPLTYVENGSTDAPWVNWYPVEFTFHNINHFEGPGQLPNIYFRTLTHVTFDRATGEAKVEVVKGDVLCR